jgi:2-polyprenyl-6-methoxyphenol hydroxylase-like FAD-dependent oxidoreductase
MTFRDTAFRLLAERDDATLSGRSICEAERRGIGRLELREILLDGLKDASVIQWGKAFSHYERLDNGRVRAYFADGTTANGDVLVGADGSRSKVREQCLPHIQREDLGIVAVAGRYILDKQRIRELPVGLTNGSLNNIVPDGKGWMFCSSWNSKPTNDTTEPDRYVVWAYVIPKEDTPANIKHLTPGALRDIAMAGTVGWSPSLTTLVRDADLSTVAPVPLKCMPDLQYWAPSNVTLLGDAIHNMPPTGGKSGRWIKDILETRGRHVDRADISPIFFFIQDIC